MTRLFSFLTRSLTLLTYTYTRTLYIIGAKQPYKDSIDFMCTKDENILNVARFVPESKYDFQQFTNEVVKLLKGLVESPNYSDFASDLCLKLSKPFDVDQTQRLKTVILNDQNS